MTVVTVSVSVFGIGSLIQEDHREFHIAFLACRSERPFKVIIHVYTVIEQYAKNGD